MTRQPAPADPLAALLGLVEEAAFRGACRALAGREAADGRGNAIPLKEFCRDNPRLKYGTALTQIRAGTFAFPTVRNGSRIYVVAPAAERILNGEAA